mmetsp:Transcript_11302/g.30901  ORF Transcript_11302/g.30901 Transcript_11302/m.30901 type:complete len:217 (-) Transcript_11302:1416-2066(-)
MLDGHVDRDALYHKFRRAERRRLRLDPVLGAVEVDQGLAAHCLRHERQLRAPGRPGRRRRGGGQRVDEPEPVLVAVLDAGLVRGPLVLGVLVGPRRRRGQHALHVPPRQIGIRLEDHRHDAGDERGRVGRAHAGVATIIGEAVGERLRGEHAVVVLRVAAGRADEDRRAGRRVRRVLEVLAERADAHREPGVLVALVVHVLADVVRVARREDKDHT